MDSDKNHKMSHTKTPATTSLKKYTAPKRTSYGDVSKLTKGNWAAGKVDSFFNVVHWGSH